MTVPVKYECQGLRSVLQRLKCKMLLRICIGLSPLFVFLLIICCIQWIYVGCPSLAFAGSVGPPSPPYGSVTSSRGSAAAYAPTQDPWGRPAQRETGWLPHINHWINSNILYWPHGDIFLGPKCYCSWRTVRCTTNNKKQYTRTYRVRPIIIMQNKSELNITPALKKHTNIKN